MQCSMVIAQLFLTVQMCVNITVNSWAVETSWPHPVELGPRYGHVAVVLRVVAAACKSFLCQEDQVILWQATSAVHLCFVLHIKGLAQLGPQHLVWHDEWHPALRRWRKGGKMREKRSSLNVPRRQLVKFNFTDHYRSLWHIGSTSQSTMHVN